MTSHEELFILPSDERGNRELTNIPNEVDEESTNEEVIKRLLLIF